MSKTHPIVQKMLETDAMTAWLQAEVIESQEGYCKLSMVIRPEMVNGFNIAHGGISFSLADSAIAFAANAFGRHSVSLQTSIRHLKPVFNGDTIIAEASVVSSSHRTICLDAVVFNQNGDKVADLQATGYRKSDEW
jgi:acyl-CoA thioesterase